MKLMFSIVMLSFVLFSCEYLAEKARKTELIKKQGIEDSIAVVKADSIFKANDFGIWRVSYYVDEFGDSTNAKYITNYKVVGTFSNSATNGSPLGIDFIINSIDDVSFELFEYNGSNPVQHSVEYGYDVKVKDKLGNVLYLSASNTSDRLKFDESNSRKLTELFLKGGQLKFSINELSEYSGSTYYFEIYDTKGFDKALFKLNKSRQRKKP